MLRVVFLLFCSGLALAEDSTDMRGLIQMVDYVGVDYGGAVANGEVVDRAEFEEMREFTEAIARRVSELEKEHGGGLNALAADLPRLVDQRAKPEVVAQAADRLRELLLERFSVATTPAAVPDLGLGKRLFAAQCAACHGADGDGQGPLAKAMVPLPVDFLDPQRAAGRSLFGLYNSITTGVPGTAMPAFSRLSEQERWSLAFFVGQMGMPKPAVAAGKRRWEAGERLPGDALESLTVLSPSAQQARLGGSGYQLASYLRTAPKLLFRSASPLQQARWLLGESADAFRAGAWERAEKVAIRAYLEGVEPAEPALEAAAPELGRQIEASMSAYRAALRQRSSVADLELQIETIEALLARAEELLAGDTISLQAAFTGSLVILLREGLEAILIVAALVAFLNKIGRHDALPYVHAGWAGALLLGVGLWLAADRLFSISGAGREVMEGVAGLTAAAVLVYMGYWLHSKTHSARWRRYIEGAVDKALGAGTLWSLAGLSFLVVFREALETILFYQALWVQSAEGAGAGIVWGFLAAAAILVVAGWLILHHSRRLPLKQFFGISAALMVALAVVFAGKGVAAMQEAGVFSFTPVALPSFELVGLRPSLEGVALQAAILLLALFLALFNARRSRLRMA